MCQFYSVNTIFYLIVGGVSLCCIIGSYFPAPGFYLCSFSCALYEDPLNFIPWLSIILDLISYFPGGGVINMVPSISGLRFELPILTYGEDFYRSTLLVIISDE